MPNDADSLTEPAVDGTSEDDAKSRADTEAVEGDQTELHTELVDDLEGDDLEDDDLEDDETSEAEPDLDTDESDADDDEPSPELVTVEDLEGPAETDEANQGDSTAGEGDHLVTLEDLGADEELIDPDDIEYEADEYGDEALLFDGDPDEFELDFGTGPYPDARPSAGDMMILDEPAAGPAPRPRQMSRMERRRRVKLQARRVRRIIRHIEPWSVLKISIFFYACLWVIFLVAGFMIWGVAESSGTVGKIESLLTQLFALQTFDFDAGQIFRGYALGGLALAIAGTTLNVLMCLLFNLISDLTGGLRITMIEEETARPTPPRRRRRRPAPQRR